MQIKQINKTNYILDLKNINTVAQLLGLDMNEPFKIQMFTHKNPYDIWYKITEHGLMYSYTISGDYCNHSNALEGLILGKHQVVKANQM